MRSRICFPFCIHLLNKTFKETYIGGAVNKASPEDEQKLSFDNVERSTLTSNKNYYESIEYTKTNRSSSIHPPTHTHTKKIIFLSPTFHFFRKYAKLSSMQILQIVKIWFVKFGQDSFYLRTKKNHSLKIISDFPLLKLVG